MIFVIVFSVHVIIVFGIIWGKKFVLLGFVGIVKYVVSIFSVKLESKKLSFRSEVFKGGGSRNK